MNLNHAFIQQGNLLPENKIFYEQYGYLIGEQLLSPAEIKELRKEAVHIFKGDRGPVPGLLDTEGLEHDDEIMQKYVAIHFPNKVSRLIKNYLSHPEIVRVLKEIISANVKCMQSMLFVKGPGKAGQSWHQDEFYIPTRDRSLTGAWIAIDDATISNGCLWIIPGSHRSGYIRQRVVNTSAEYADVDTVDVSDFPGTQQIPVQVKSGTVVFFNGYTLHSSLRNKTKDCFRMALVNHYMSAESMLPWDQDGKLPPTEDLRDIELVAGTDPYAWKGTEDGNKPYLRPEVLKIKTTY